MTGGVGRENFFSNRRLKLIFNDFFGFLNINTLFFKISQFINISSNKDVSLSPNNPQNSFMTTSIMFSTTKPPVPNTNNLNLRWEWIIQNRRIHVQLELFFRPELQTTHLQHLKIEKYLPCIHWMLVFSYYSCSENLLQC